MFLNRRHNEASLLADARERRVLYAPIAGLALAATVANVSVRMAHRTAGVSEFGGAPTILAAIVLGLLFLSTLLVKRFTKRFISAGTFLSIHLAGLSSLVLAFIVAMGTSIPQPAFIALEACALVGSTFLEFYWLRKLRGTSAQAATVVVFCALALSELLTYMLSFSDVLTWRIVAIVFTFAQFGGIRMSRTMDAPSDMFPAVSESYFGTDENRFSNRSFLVVAAMGIWFISIPMGMGRGFSTGDALFMSTVPRFMVMVFVLIVSALWVRHALASHMRQLTTSIWVVMQTLLALGAIFFAVWPNTTGIGAAFVMAASLVLQAFVWYLIIAFTSFGWRDPFYYCTAAWIAVNLLTVAGMLLDGLITRIMPDNAPVIISIMSFFVLVSTQVVFTQLLSSPSEMAERRAVADATKAGATEGYDDGEAVPDAGKPLHLTQDDVRRIPLMGVMALSPQTEVALPSQTPDVHIATSVLEIGQRFGLSGREVEVLTLYALGHTQARVSKELQLSQNTVHTHIKRIYEKTDLHSRQEILDYISEYGKQ